MLLQHCQLGLQHRQWPHERVSWVQRILQVTHEGRAWEAFDTTSAAGRVIAELDAY
jgi:hypothetical protein